VQGERGGEGERGRGIGGRGREKELGGDEREREGEREEGREKVGRSVGGGRETLKLVLWVRQPEEIEDGVESVGDHGERLGAPRLYRGKHLREQRKNYRL